MSTTEKQGKLPPLNFKAPCQVSVKNTVFLGCFEKIAVCIMKGLKPCAFPSKLSLMFGESELRLYVVGNNTS